VRAVFFLQGERVPAARVRGFAIARALEARGLACSVRAARPSVYGDTRLPWPLDRPRPLYVPIAALARLSQLRDLRADDVVIFQRPMTELPTLALERLAECSEVQDSITSASRDATVGQTRTVLVDSPGNARSVHEAPEIDGIIAVPAELEVGGFHEVVVTGSFGTDLLAMPR